MWVPLLEVEIQLIVFREYWSRFLDSIWFKFDFIASMELSLPMCLHSNCRNLVTQASPGKQIWCLSRKQALEADWMSDFCISVPNWLLPLHSYKGFPHFWILHCSSGFPADEGKSVLVFSGLIYHVQHFLVLLEANAGMDGWEQAV